MYRFIFSLVLYLSVSTLYAADSTHIVIQNPNSVERPDLPFTIGSDNFIIHYGPSTSGSYAQNTSDYAEYSYQRQCTEFGWPVPPPDDNRGGDNRYDIYLVEDGTFNVTRAEVPAGWTNEWAPSYIEIRNNLNDDASGELKITVAHEFNHATQIAYTYRDGYETNNFWFYENTATLIAEEVYNYQYKYYENSFGSFDPLTVPGAQITSKQPGDYLYSGFLWPKFLSEWQNDDDIVRTIWQRMGETLGPQTLDDIDYTLVTSYENDLNEALRIYAEWRYFTGVRDDGYHYQDASSYPTSSILRTHSNNIQNQSFTLSGPGGTQFVEFYIGSEAITVSMNGSNNQEYRASAIEVRLTGPYVNHQLYLDASSDGSVDAIMRLNQTVVFAPVQISSAKNVNGTYSASNPELRAVKFTNEIDNSNTGGQLSVDGQAPFSSGDLMLLQKNTSHSVKTLDERFILTDIYKHNHWNADESDFLLSNNFLVPFTGNTDQDADFEPIKPATIRNTYDEVILDNVGTVEFNDPWYVLDSMDNQSGVGNFLTFTSPYSPTGHYNETTGGVFLNQDPALTPTYYSVGALDEQPINLGGGLGTHKFYFQNWTGTDVNFQDANANQTGVVFTGSNAVVNANLKGNLLSNSPGGISTNSQRKIVRTDNGYYHLVYESLGNVYYTHSLTTDFYGDWTREEMLMTNATNPSLDYVGNDVYIVYEIYDTDYSNQPVVHLLKLLYDNGTWFLDWYTDVAYNEVSNLGYAKPVVYARSDEVFVIAKLSANEKLKYTYIIDPENSSSQWSTPADLPGTYQYSVDPTLAGGKLNNDDRLHISYEGKNRIYYLFSYRAGSQRRFNTPVDISSGSSYSINKYPSISLVNNQFYPIITWRGAYKTNVAEKRMGKENAGMIWIYKTVVRVKSSLGWGTFSAFGSKVDYPNINSIETNDETIIAWSENQGQYAKYVKRAGSFRQTQPLSSNGTYVQLSNGSDLGNLKAIVFNIEDLPLYNLVRTTDDFAQEFGGGGLGKETNVFDLSYGRSGVIEKSDVEFVFNIGDIFLNGETVKFIERADTLPVTNIAVLNSSVKTENMQLSSSSELLFSNYYYVVRPKLADSVLSDDFTVTFKCELVKSATNEVVGVFDQVTYSKYNVGKYDNPNYIVDFTGIEQGKYYFRLITEVNGESNPSLTNIEKDNINLEKLNYKNIGFTGSTLPEEYALSQNYPNPFNPSTTIRYQLPQDGFVTLKIYDILGREVTTLVNEEKTKGRYEINFNASSLASGVYLYRLMVNDFITVKKMLMIK